MNYCARQGYLVNATYTLPTDPVERDVEYLPTIGCSRLRCHRCGEAVRNERGLSFASPREVDAKTLAALYAMPDLSTSPLIHKTNKSFRLYLCGCDRWLEVREHALAEPDPDPATDPDKPWQCDGHPLASLPYDVDGHLIPAGSDLRVFTDGGLRGAAPPRRTREADRESLYWLLRLYTRLDPHDAATMCEVACATLADHDQHAVSASLRFLFHAGRDTDREAVFTLLETKPDLLAAPVDMPLAKADRTLADTAWRVIAPLIARSGRARDLARSEALAGHANRQIHAALAAYDPDWFIARIEDLARAAPGNAGLLLDSFLVLPVRTADHAARVRSALLAGDEPLGEIRASARALAKRVRREVPFEGSVTPIRLQLPRLPSGPSLELEVVGLGDRQRSLDLRVKRATGTTHTQTLRTGTKTEIIVYLDGTYIADRIIYRCLAATS